MKNFDKISKVLKNDLISGVIMVVIFIALLFVSMMLTSCAGNSASPEKALLQQPALAKTEKLNNELFQKGAELTTKNLSAADYKIGPDDLLEIDVFEAKDLKTAVRVSSQGFIKLPIGDMIKASGCTVTELEARIAASLKKFMVEPMVSVFIKEYKSQQVSVLGYVKTPGIYYVTGQKSLLDLLSMAGGLNPEGSDTCIIQKAAGVDQNGHPQPEKNIMVDLNELLTNGRAELNLQVISGDIIYVPKAGVYFVDGAVVSPGLYPLKGNITLVQALSIAKGLNYEAYHSCIKIYRDIGKPERELITANYDAILDGKDQDIFLHDKDIIIVGSNAFKTVLKGIAGYMTFGAFSLGRTGGL